MSKRLIVFLVGLVSCTSIIGQKKADLSLLREFAEISRGYQQLPLYLDLEIKGSSNFITSEADTNITRGQFYLQKERSYVHFGEFEQLINDSMALLISNQLHQMILYTNAKPIVQQMQSWMNGPLPDSSITKLTEKYKPSAKEGADANSSVIALQSRLTLPWTTTPKESIELLFDKKSRLPIRVSVLQRKLISLDSVRYQELSGNNEMAKHLLKIKEGYYLVKEQTTDYVYHKIELASTASTPVLIVDRIIRNDEGEYKPVQKFENYRITINN